MQRWAWTVGADYAFKAWDDECVLHHRLSNDTHRLSAAAAELLRAVHPGPRSAADLSSELETDEATVLAALQTLADLGLVRSC